MESTSLETGHFSHVQLCATPWTEKPGRLQSIGLHKQEYWNGLLFLSPGDLPNSGSKPMFLMSPALAGRFFTTSATWEAP